MNALTSPRASVPSQLALETPAPDRRLRVDLWELLRWTYQDQKAGRLGIGRGLMSKYRWMKYMAELDNDGRPWINVDAAAVHRVVCGILDPETARLVIEVAQVGVEPEPSTQQPMPKPMPNRERGNGGGPYTIRGEWVEVPAIQLTAAERRKLRETDGHGEVERSAVPGGALKWRYRIDLRARRRCKRARIVHNVDGSPRATNVGFGQGDQLWSQHCVIEYSPSPEYVALVNAIHERWCQALDLLDPALMQIPFRTRRLIPRSGVEAGASHDFARGPKSLID